MEEKTILYCGVRLDIIFHYTPAHPAICNPYGVMEDQGSDEDFELLRVLAGETDILPILTEDQQTEIIKIIEEDRE